MVHRASGTCPSSSCITPASSQPNRTSDGCGVGWGWGGEEREGHDDREEGELGEYTSWSRGDYLFVGSIDVTSMLGQLYSAGRHDGQRRSTTAAAGRSGWL